MRDVKAEGKKNPTDRFYRQPEITVGPVKL
jgi:hypothetical protein